MTKQDAITFLTYQRELGERIRDHQRVAFITMMYRNQFDAPVALPTDYNVHGIFCGTPQYKITME